MAQLPLALLPVWVFFKLLVSKGIAKPRSEDYFLHFCLFPYKSCLASVNALRSYLGVLPRGQEFPFCKLIAEIPDACHAKHQRAEPENAFKLHLIRRAGIWEARVHVPKSAILSPSTAVASRDICQAPS